MLLADKLKNLIENSQYKTIAAFHRALVEKMGVDGKGRQIGISLKTLFRTLNNETTIRESSLHQIGTVLNLNVVDIRKGTEAEKSDLEGVTPFRYGSTQYRIKYDGLPYDPEKIKFKEDGTTDILGDDPRLGNCTKFVWGWYGSVDVYLLNPTKAHLDKTDKKNYNLVANVTANIKSHTLNNYFIFDSSIPHFFRNSSKKSPAGLLVIHYPRPN